MKRLTRKEENQLWKILDSKAVSITVTLANGSEITMSKENFDDMYSHKEAQK